MTDTSYLKTHVAWLRGRAADYDAQGFLSMAEDYSNRADRIDALLAELEDDADMEGALLAMESEFLCESGERCIDVRCAECPHTPQPQVPEGCESCVFERQRDRLFRAMKRIVAEGTSRKKAVRIALQAIAAAKESE